MTLRLFGSVAPVLLLSLFQSNRSIPFPASRCELVLFCGSSMPPFEKKCLECGNTVHVRKLNCSCGCGFSRKSKRYLTSENSIKQSVEANEKCKKANVACQTRKRALLTYQESQQWRQTNAACPALKRSLESEKS